jgi:hypothetical protein
MFARPQTTFFYSVDTCGGYLFAATDEYGVLRSSDAGTTWIQVDSGLPAKNVQSLVSYQNMLFCGMNGQGVCLSTDYGMTWRGVSSGTNLYHVYSMVVAGAYLLAGADGHGLWRRSLSDFDLVNEERHPTTYLQLESNYPDPLTTSTIISFTLPARSFVTLSVIDCAGREAVVLAREVLDAGRHEVPWDASGFASGVYTCRLQAGGESAMGKMVVLH